MTISTATLSAVNDSINNLTGNPELNATLQLISGTFSGLQLIFEARSTLTAPWYKIQARRTDDRSLPSSFNSEVLSGIPDYAWQLSIPICYEIRARALALSSGSASFYMITGSGSLDSAVIEAPTQFDLAVASPTGRFANPPTNTTPLALSTAYQALDPTKPALITVNVTSTASISLTTGQTHTCQVVMGATSAVAGGTGTAVPSTSNSNTGTLVIGLALSTVAAVPFVFVLPAGWYFAVIRTTGAGGGSPVVVTATDQSLSVSAS